MPSNSFYLYTVPWWPGLHCTRFGEVKRSIFPTPKKHGIVGGHNGRMFFFMSSLINVISSLFGSACLVVNRNSVAPVVSLDTKKYKLVQQLDAATPHGVPSLIHCDRLSVEGPVIMAGGITFKVGGVEWIELPLCYRFLLHCMFEAIFSRITGVLFCLFF